LHTLRRRFGIKEATFVFDGGMSSRINLEAMTEAKLGYELVYKQPLHLVLRLGSIV
jgi:transposase